MNILLLVPILAPLVAAVLAAMLGWRRLSASVTVFAALSVLISSLVLLPTTAQAARIRLALARGHTPAEARPTVLPSKGGAPALVGALATTFPVPSSMRAPSTPMSSTPTGWRPRCRRPRHIQRRPSMRKT